MKDLVEVIGAGKDLIRQTRCQDGVQHERVIAYVDGSHFKIVFQI